MSELTASAPGVSALQRLRDNSLARRAVIFAGFAALWQLYALWLGNALLLPTVDATLSALWAAIVSGELPDRTLTSLRVLLTGYVIGIAIAAVLAAVAVLSRWGNDALRLLTSMFNPCRRSRCCRSRCCGSVSARRA